MQRCSFMDSKGLVCKSRDNLQPHKTAFAHDVPFQPDLMFAIEAGLYSLNAVEMQLTLSLNAPGCNP
jgi:hypothetical protein